MSSTIITCPVCDGQGKLVRIDLASLNPYPQIEGSPKYDLHHPNRQVVTCTQCNGQGTVVSSGETVTLFRGLEIRG